MPEILISGLFGLLIGSFLNVCIYRLPRDESVVHPRSHCPSCQRPIAPYDNIPVLSYLLLRGRCRSCGWRIPVRYPLVELLTGALFAACVAIYGFGIEGGKACLFVAIQVALVFSDFEERILPDEFTIGGTLAGVALAAMTVPTGITLLRPLLSEPGSSRVSAMLVAARGALLLSAALWCVGFLYAKIRHREGLGLGDVKMIACIGAFLGEGNALLAMTIGSVLGSITGVLWILRTGKDASTYQLPFGTFLGIGAIITVLLPPFGFSLL